jgi:hypothetical protein
VIAAAAAAAARMHAPNMLSMSLLFECDAGMSWMSSVEKLGRKPSLQDHRMNVRCCQSRQGMLALDCWPVLAFAAAVVAAAHPRATMTALLWV